MTCIAAVTDGKTVWMGADAAGVSNWELTIRADPKVFISGNFLIGFTTSFRMGQLLHHRFTPPPCYDGRDPFSFMAVDFVDAVRHCLKDGGWAEKFNEQERGGQFIVGLKGRIFTVDSDFQVGEPVVQYAAIGCGGTYALGALHATPDKTPAIRVETALRAAEYHSAGVRGPFTILSHT